jgi:hypothetical protein
MHQNAAKYLVKFFRTTQIYGFGSIFKLFTLHCWELVMSVHITSYTYQLSAISLII